MTAVPGTGRVTSAIFAVTRATCGPPMTVDQQDRVAGLEIPHICDQTADRVPCRPPEDILPRREPDRVRLVGLRLAAK